MTTEKQRLSEKFDDLLNEYWYCDETPSSEQKDEIKNGIVSLERERDTFKDDFFIERGRRIEQDSKIAGLEEKCDTLKEQLNHFSQDNVELTFQESDTHFSKEYWQKKAEVAEAKVKAYKQGAELQAGIDWHQPCVDMLARLVKAQELVLELQCGVCWHGPNGYKTCVEYPNYSRCENRVLQRKWRSLWEAINE